jgi:hypothetical protein
LCGACIAKTVARHIAPAWMRVRAILREELSS